MSKMSVRAFPRTHKKPRKRILLVPLILIFGGYGLMLLHPYLGTGYLGIIISMVGVFTIFVVGMVFADLWAASRRTAAIIRERERLKGVPDHESFDEEEITDPFEEDI